MTVTWLLLLLLVFWAVGKAIREGYLFSEDAILAMPLVGAASSKTLERILESLGGEPVRFFESVAWVNELARAVETGERCLLSTITQFSPLSIT